MKFYALMFIGALTFGTHAEAMNIMSLDDVAVAQQTEEGYYNVICTNGNRETVSDVDVRLGNVCPNNSASVVTGILSLQKRDDGDFDVVCRDLTKIVATTAEILNNEVCKTSAPTVAIEDGVYWAPSSLDCTVKANYTDGVLTSLHAAFDGTYSDMTCENNLCTGMFTGYSQTYYIEVTGPTTFDFSYDNRDNITHFTKKN